MKKLLYLIPIFFIIACTSYPEAIEEALQQAGSNRKELKAVLKHYAKNPSDSLKLRAAEFLIANMPGKFSIYYDAPWNDVATVYLRWTSSSNKQMVLDHYKLGKQVIKVDVQHITSDYLINNIELSFKVWQETPWGKDISFDVFCEEILPYRLGNEPLENWREKVLTSFADIYQSFIQDTSINAVRACIMVNDKLPRFRMDKDFNHMSYSQLMASTRGTCDAMAALTVFVMRGLGIPVTREHTPKYVETVTGHSWNSVGDTVHISFMGTETNPGLSHQGTTFLSAKIYRTVYSNQGNLKTDMENIPPALNNINNSIDVTAEYANCVDVQAPLLNSHLNKTGYAYLAILQGKEWYPVGWGVVMNEHIEFLSVRKNVYYLPVYYNQGVQSPASYPFILRDNDSFYFFKPDTLQITGPFNGPHLLSSAKPYTLKSVDFDFGGFGHAYYDTTPATGDSTYRIAGGDVSICGVDIQSDMESIGFTASGEWLLYTVEVEDAGKYIVEVEVAVEGDTKIHFEVDGVDVTGLVSYGSTGGWDSWQWMQLSKPLALSKGSHQIKFFMDIAYFNFRNFRFTYEKETIRKTTPFRGPHILTSENPYILKSVDFDKGGQGISFYDTNPTSTGGESYRRAGGDYNSKGMDIEHDSVSIGYINAGEWIIYTLEVHDTGKYLVSVEIASIGTGLCHLELNGINVTGAVTLPVTGGWEFWSWYNIPTPIELPKGKQQLRFYCGSNQTFNLRNLKFTYQ